MTHVPQLRPMGLLEIIDQTFRLYRSNFWLFFGITAVVYVPLGVIQAVSSVGQVVVGLLTIPAGLLVTGALTKAVSDRYMGDETTIGGSYLYITKRLIPFVLTVLLAYLLVIGGVLLLFVGALIFSFWIAFVTEVFIIEDKHYSAAISRSRFLIGQGVWAEVLVLGLITGLIGLAIEGVGSLPVYVLTALGTDKASLWLLSGFISGVAQTLAVPIALVASILLYYDSRIKKEGFDLEILARELGKELPAPQTPPQAPSGAIVTPQQWMPTAASEPATPSPPAAAEPMAGEQPTTSEPSDSVSSTPAPPSDQEPPPASQPTGEGSA